MRILLLRFSALGDVVMTAWTATALKQAIPESQITWAVQPRCAPLISPELASVELVPRDRGERNSFLAMIKFGLALRKRRFDWGLDFQGHTKTAVTLRLAAPKRRLSLRATDVIAGLFSRPVKVPGELTHIIEREAWLAAQVTPISLPSFPILPQVEAQPKGDGRPLVTVQMGAGWKGKAYPPELMSEAIRLLEREGCRVVALGGISDPHPESGEDLVGRTDLIQTLSWLKSSRVHLSPDTGTGHMAAALGTPLVTIFGPEDPAKCRPWGSSVTLLKEGSSTSAVSPQQAVSAVLKAMEEGQ